jgi:membrane fusion protein (multidrug efflux system)
MTIIKSKSPHFPKCIKPLVVLGLCLSLLQACTKQEAVKQEEEAEAEVEHHVSLPTKRVSTMPVQKHLTFPGKVTALPDHSVSVTPNIAGKITRVLVVPGQKVSKGELMALLDDRQLVAQLQQTTAPQRTALNQVVQAKIALDLALKNLTRSEALFAKDIVAEKDVIAARSQVELCKAQVEAAEARVAEAKVAPLNVTTQLAWTKVVSPISGVIAQRFLNVGDMTDPSKPIAHVVNLSTVIIDANMPADSPADPKVGQTASVTTVALPGIKYGAKITAVSPVVDPANNTVSIQLLCRNERGRLKEGQQAVVSIATVATRAALIPQTALVPGADDPAEHFVYVVRGGKLKLTKVTVGDAEDGKVPVFEGLFDGDEVVTSGAYGVPNGAILDRGEPAK